MSTKGKPQKILRTRDWGKFNAQLKASKGSGSGAHMLDMDKRKQNKLDREIHEQLREANLLGGREES